MICLGIRTATVTMQTAEHVLFVASVLFFMQAAASEAEQLTLSCKAGFFTAGQNASVTCHFNQNISESFHHIYVTLYASSNTKGLPEEPSDQSGTGKDVLVCIRLRNKKLHCKEEAGYHFNKLDENTFNFVISEVTAAHAGHYACQLVPPDDLPTRKKCYLHVQPVPCGSRTEPSSERKADLGSPTSTLVIFLSVATSVLAVSVILLATLYFLSRRQRRRRSEEFPLSRDDSL